MINLACHILLILMSNMVPLCDAYRLYFVVALFAIIAEVAYRRRVYLVHVWSFSFVFTIVSEGVVSYSDLAAFGWSGLYVGRMFLTLNSLICIIAAIPGIKSRQVSRDGLDSFALSAMPLSYVWCVFVVLFLPHAYVSYTQGRNAGWDGLGMGGLLLQCMYVVAMGLPSLIVYARWGDRGRRRVAVEAVGVGGVWILLFMTGNRFPLMFSVVGYFMCKIGGAVRMSLVKKILVTIVAALGVSVSSLMMSSRTTGVAVANGNYLQQPHQSISTDFITWVASVMSPEGVLSSFSLMVNHFQMNDHQHGASSLYLTYFWVPRSVWPNKPTMLGHWMVRATSSGFGEGHSASYGFCGDAYADFGLYGAIGVSILIGCMIRSLDLRIWSSGFKNNLAPAARAMLFPWVFFFVRSPLTSTIAYLEVVLLCLVVHRIFALKNGRVLGIRNESSNY